MTDADKFAFLVQTECIMQVFSGDMALAECQVIMSGLFGIADKTIDEALERGDGLYELAHSFISWKVCETLKPNWIK